MIKHIVLAGILMLGALPAFAQQQSRPPFMPPSAPQQFTVQEAVQQIFAMGVTTGQQVEARIRDMQKQIDDLRAYAVACGDKPGCFIAAPSQ